MRRPPDQSWGDRVVAVQQWGPVQMAAFLTTLKTAPPGSFEEQDDLLGCEGRQECTSCGRETWSSADGRREGEYLYS
jgi:hypothetical protein